MSTSVTTERRTLHVRLLTPQGSLYDGPSVMVVAPSVLGEVGLLPRHAPLIAFLRMGETRITLPDDTKQIFATTLGYLSIENDEVLIMVEQAEEVGTIDRTRVEESLRRGEEMVAQAGDDEIQRNAGEARIARAANRLKVLDRAAGGRPGGGQSQ